MRQRNFRRLPDVLKTISLFIGIGLCFYFLFGSFSDYNLWRYYEKIDPSAAELYEIGFWLSIIKAGASLLVPLVIYLITRRNNKR